MNNNGTLIVIDALDGAGKETQTRLLSEYLYSIGVDYKLASFPNYNSPSSYGVTQMLDGHFKDKNPYAKSVLFAYDRLLSMNSKQTNGEDITTLKEFYDDGGVILCDRYTSSNILYQSIDLKNDDDVKSYIDWIHDLEYNKLELPKPDKIIFLDVEPEVSLENIAKRNQGFDTYENLEKLTKVYQGVETLKRVGYEMDYISCTDNGKMKSIEEINQLIIKQLEDLL